jgi:hypothetical protein
LVAVAISREDYRRYALERGVRLLKRGWRLATPLSEKHVAVGYEGNDLRQLTVHAFSLGYIVVCALKATSSVSNSSNRPSRISGKYFQMIIASCVRVLSIPGAVRTSRCAADKVNLKFSVADTGIGIAPENQETIFIPFTQAITCRIAGQAAMLTGGAYRVSVRLPNRRQAATSRRRGHRLQRP